MRCSKILAFDGLVGVGEPPIRLLFRLLRDLMNTLFNLLLCGASAVSLFQIRRQHIFDPFHECADSARQIAPMCYDEGHGERPAAKIGYDLHKRSTL